ncbi:MAG: hypothetical protein ACRCWR_08020 [Saezia sp.]
MVQISMPEGGFSNSTAQTGDSPLIGGSNYRAFRFLINMICFFSGLVLLGIGAYLIYYILSEIYQAYLQIDQNIFVGTLVEWLENKPIFLNSNNEPFLLGRAGAVIVSVILGYDIGVFASLFSTAQSY